MIFYLKLKNQTNSQLLFSNSLISLNYQLRLTFLLVYKTFDFNFFQSNCFDLIKAIHLSLLI